MAGKEWIINNSARAGRILVVFCFVLFIFLPAAVSAAGYYVDFTLGSESNAGTQAAPLKFHPWMASSTAGITLQAGDTVYMKRGEQWIGSGPTTPWMTVAQSGSAGNYITTTAYGSGAQPLIKINTDSAQNVIYAAGKSYIKFDNLHIQHWSGTAYGPNTQDGIQFTKDAQGNLPHDWIITNNEIDNIPGVGIQSMSDAYNIIIGDINATQTATQSSYSNNIHHFGYAGVILIGRNPATSRSDFSVYYNYVHDATRPNCGDNEYGIMFTARPGVVSAWPAYATARYNRVENIETYEGLDTHGGSYLYYLDNYIYNTSLPMMAGGVTVAGLTDTSDHYYIENNIIEQPINQRCNSLGKAFIWVGGFTSDSNQKIANSYIKNNKLFFTTRPAESIPRSGIQIGPVDNLEIDGNEIYNSHTVSSGMTAILFENDGFSNVTIKNNHIHDWGLRSIYLNLAGMQGPVSILNNIIASAWGIGLRWANVTQNLNINNNTFLTDTTFAYSPWAVIWEGDGDGIAPPATVNIKNNTVISYPGTGGYHMSNGSGNMNSSLFINNNLYYNSTNIANYWSAWRVLGYDTLGFGANVNPLLTNSSGNYSAVADFVPLWNSPLIDAGASVSLTTDKAGNPVYGAPDIGSYEYQPPYTMGTDRPDIAGNIRIYANGKFRNTTSTVGTTANLTIAPVSGFSSANYTAWLDLDINEWNTTSSYTKQWVESTTNSGLTTSHTVGDLQAAKYYTIYFTKFGEAKTRLTAAVTNSSGQLTFTYDKGYSTVIFDLEEDTATPTAFTLSSPPSGESTYSARPTFTWSASSDAGSGLLKYQLYVDNALNTDSISTTTLSTAPSTDLSCGSHSWYIKAVDYAGLSTTTAPFNLTIVCATSGGSSGSVSSATSTPSIIPTLLINNGAATTTQSHVELKLAAGTDVKKMKIANTIGFEGSNQEDFKTTVKNWSLCSTITTSICPAGHYTVYAKFYDQAGVSVSTVSDTIYFSPSAAATSTQPAVITEPSLPVIPTEAEESLSSSSTEPQRSGGGVARREAGTNLATGLTGLNLARSLSPGLKSSQVAELQDALKELGYLSEKIPSTGYFGSATKEAVKDYQKSVGIYPAGVVGPRTRKALASQDFITNKDYRFNQDLKYNDKAEDVKQLQIRLKDQNFFPWYLKPTGWFGPITERSVKLFQGFYRLLETGWVNEPTRGVLNWEVI